MAASQSNPSYHHGQVWLNKADPEIRIHYVEALPTSQSAKGTIVLVHGFPETSYQFRHVMGPLTDAGYRVIAPDQRGAGYSSKPEDGTGFTKDILSKDIHDLVTNHLGIKDPVHLVGHDTGGMLTHAYVVQFPNDVASITWGECPLPGTKHYHATKNSPTLWHFTFHAQSDIAEALVAGREKLYIKSFYDRLSQNPHFLTQDDLDYYAVQYATPGALRCSFKIYKAFEADAAQNEQWLREKGKVQVRNMVLSGDRSFIQEGALAMAREMYEDPVEGTVENCGHWLAEENPEDFVKKVLGFIES